MIKLRDALERLQRALACRCHAEEEYRKAQAKLSKLERDYRAACDEHEAAERSLELLRAQLISNQPDDKHN